MNDKQKLDVWSHFETQIQKNRIVLLGASNLTRAFPKIIYHVLASFERPLSVVCAMGCGRSYGQESSFFAKKNLGIFHSKIWDALERDFQTPTTAFVTDIGNDLAYEVPVETVVEWVKACLDRLEKVGAHIVMNDLPMSALRGVGASRYRLFRTVFFPYCRLSWSEMLDRAEKLSEQLHTISNSRNIPIFIGEKEDHHLDPIHPRSVALMQTWREMFALAGIELRENSIAENRFLLTRYLRSLRPESWRFFWLQRHSQQPCGRLHDGTTIELY